MELVQNGVDWIALVNVVLALLLSYVSQFVNTSILQLTSESFLKGLELNHSFHFNF